MAKSVAQSARTAETHWSQSRQPLASLVFLAPLLLAYEVGVSWFGVRNGADAFMSWLLERLGFGRHLVLPLLLVCLLLAWHHASRRPWRISAGTFWAMAAESLALGVCLCAVLYLQRCATCSIDAAQLRGLCGRLRNAVGFLGAGIYEELLFRLILLSAAAWTLRRFGLPPRTSLLAAIAISSVLFATAHHIGPAGQPFRPFDFAFRTLAGGFFAVVFLYRGFGIAAGSHAAYDLLVGVVY